MTIKQRMNELPWRLIVALGLFALARPIIKIFGDVFDYEVSPMVTAAITAVIAVTWVGIVARLNINKPIIVLALSGVVYAVSSIALATIIQLTVPDLANEEAKIPVLLTVGLIATTIFNAVYGALLGVIAQALQRSLHK